MVGALPEPLLRNELRICSDAMENLFGVGTRHAMPFYYPDIRKPEESSQDERMRHSSNYDMGGVVRRPSREACRLKSLK